MKRPTLALILLLAPASASLPPVAQAQTRPQTPAMSCAQVQALIARAGGIVLGTGGYTYDRYVADTRFCLIGQSTRRELVPTRDTPSCPVNTCFDPTGLRFLRD